MHKIVAFAMLVVASVADVTAAHADGFYDAESFGVAETHDDIHRSLANAFDVRLGIGMRIGNLAVEPWLAADRNLTDGDGRVDLGSWGLDFKYLTSLTTALPHLEVYVRGGFGVAQPTGTLEGYSGRGGGMGAGIQLSGKVRALGFLWTPLFFLHRGPMVTGAIYIDDGLDIYSLHRPGDPSITVELVHLSVGFAVGSAF
jgi:hypothetical protein